MRTGHVAGVFVQIPQDFASDRVGAALGLGGPTGHLRHNTRKAQRFQVECVNEDIDGADRIVFTYVIVEELGQQNALPAVLPFDKALHQEPRLNPSGF